MRSDTAHCVFHSHQPARDLSDRLIAQQAEVRQAQGGFDARARRHGDTATHGMHRIRGLCHRFWIAANYKQIMAIMRNAAGPCAASEPGIGDETHRAR